MKRLVLIFWLMLSGLAFAELHVFEQEDIARYAHEGKFCEVYGHRWKSDVGIIFAEEWRARKAGQPAPGITSARTCSVCGRQEVEKTMWVEFKTKGE